MHKTLYIELFQPYAQYRNPFTFYYAQVFPLPPKSAIIGMLQNACNDWYGKNSLDKWNALKVSVHGGFESVFWNYQSLIKGKTTLDENDQKILQLYNQNLPLYGNGKTSQRTPTYQAELFNGYLFIFLSGDEDLLEKIKLSLTKPSKIIYLGRSEDIVYIRKVSEIQGEQVNENITDIELKYPTYLKATIPIDSEKYPVYYIPSKVIFKNDGTPVKSKNEITRNTKRETEFVTVLYTGFNYALNVKEPIKATRYSIEDNREIYIIDDFGWL